jgi:hypothetical protein
MVGEFAAAAGIPIWHGWVAPTVFEAGEGGGWGMGKREWRREIGETMLDGRL